MLLEPEQAANDCSLRQAASSWLRNNNSDSLNKRRSSGVICRPKVLLNSRSRSSQAQTVSRSSRVTLRISGNPPSTVLQDLNCFRVGHGDDGFALANFLDSVPDQVLDAVPQQLCCMKSNLPSGWLRKRSSHSTTVMFVNTPRISG
jgi:hypothetical protein